MRTTVPTIAERILELLARHPEGLDDDQIAQLLGLSRRQQANSRCRDLEAMALVRREHVRNKLHNFLVKRAGAETALTVEPVDQVQHVREEHVQHARTETSSADWFWEGSVQAAVARHLTSERYTILRVADTRSRETGKDIVASRGGAELWVTVKGYPRGIDRTRPSTQAGHWFKQGCFDLVTRRGQNRDVDLAYALPDFPRYRALATRVVWLQPHLRFAFLWVREDGAVTPEPPSVDVA